MPTITLLYAGILGVISMILAAGAGGTFLITGIMSVWAIIAYF